MNPATHAYLNSITAQLMPRRLDPAEEAKRERLKAEMVAELLAEVEAHAKLRPPPASAETEAAIAELRRRALWP